MPQAATGLRTRRIRQRVKTRRVGLSTLRDAAATFRPTTLLLLAIWLGLSTGFIELVVFDLRWRFVDRTALSALQLNQHALWMVPLSHTMVFATCGLILALVARLIRALGGRRGALWPLFSVGFRITFHVSRPELDRPGGPGGWDRA